MSKPAHVTIENLNRRHLPDAVEVIAQAFFRNALALKAFPNLDDEIRLRRVRRVYRSVMEIAFQRGRIFVVREAGRITGAAVVYPPRMTKPSLISRLLSGFGALTIGPGPTMRYAAYEREIRKLQPNQPHWYLFFLGVNPTQQSEGVGSAFVRHVCRLADADRVPCYLETTVAELVPFYQKFGFELQQQKSLKFLDGLVVNTMMRQPTVVS